ncbi:hypothetical protein GCM10025734_76940 [Kitasatospora paranensis]
MANAARRASSAATGAGSRVSSSKARQCIAVPTWIAAGTPKTLHSVGRPLRTISRSMMSSWTVPAADISVPATAALRTPSQTRRSLPAQSRATRAGLRRKPTGVDGLPSASTQPNWYSAIRRTGSLSAAVASRRAGSR